MPQKTSELRENTEISNYGSDNFESRMTHWAYMFNTQVALIEVDIKSGEIKVLDVISVNDVGKVLNKKIIEGQIHGGILQGIGYAITENFAIEKGFNKTNSFSNYEIPTADFTPNMKSFLLEIPHPNGPQGVKGFAEGPSISTAPAILNAFYDATKKRILDTPANKERVLQVLET